MAEPPGETGGTEASENGGGRGWGGREGRQGPWRAAWKSIFKNDFEEINVKKRTHSPHSH